MNLLVITGPAALLFVVIFAILAAFPVLLYLLNMQSTLKEISFENRKMQPEHVWLSLIPLFGIIWQYVLVARMADSLRLEFDKRNIHNPESRPGYTMGLLYSVLLSASVIPYLGFLLFAGGIVCWILYWLKINDYRNTLRQNPPHFIEI